jgi:hypothetical protein
MELVIRSLKYLGLEKKFDRRMFSKQRVLMSQPITAVVSYPHESLQLWALLLWNLKSTWRALRRSFRE